LLGSLDRKIAHYDTFFLHIRKNLLNFLSEGGFRKIREVPCPFKKGLTQYAQLWSRQLMKGKIKLQKLISTKAIKVSLALSIQYKLRSFHV
jgi:hypothetical protein